MSIINIYSVYLLKEEKDIHFQEGSLGPMEESSKQQCQASNSMVTAATEGLQMALRAREMTPTPDPLLRKDSGRRLCWNEVSPSENLPGEF